MSQFSSLKDTELGSILINGINVTTYKPKVRELGLKSKTWLPDKFQNSNRYYFEMQILSSGASAKISFGLIDEIGCRFVYQADGKIFYNGKYIPSDNEIIFDKENAIVGCGIDFAEQKPFFILPDGTRRYLPASRRADPFVSLTPFVTLNNKDECIAVNFGERNFTHDPFRENSIIPTHFVRQRDLKYEMDEFCAISVTSDDKIHYRSLQANRKFDRSDPTMIPYFEIKIINADSHIMMGYSNVFFDTYTSLGTIRNAVGWFDPIPNCDHVSTNQSEPLVQTSGDIFGCGIMKDSYNALRAFITKNGKWIGFVAGCGVSDGMDCFPTISFLGSATVSYNFGASKFVWDTNNAPKHRRTAGINGVPTEVLSIIFEYAGHSDASTYGRMGTVNREWRQIKFSLDPHWRRLFYKKCPNQPRNLTVKDWYRFYYRKAAHRPTMKTNNGPRNQIRNCIAIDGCHLVASNFNGVKDGDTKVLCEKCQKNVILVETVGQLRQHGALGLCVGFRAKEPKIEVIKNIEDW